MERRERGGKAVSVRCGLAGERRAGKDGLCERERERDIDTERERQSERERARESEREREREIDLEREGGGACLLSRWGGRKRRADQKAAGREGDGADSARERAGWRAAGRGKGARAN
jgi:hypothetical protein